MEPKFQTSFIPKKTVDNSSDRYMGSSSNSVDDINIFSLAATLIFIGTVLLFGGLFFYKNMLNKQLVQAGDEVNAARSAIEPEKIKEILDVNSRISASATLLENHLVTSELLLFLGETVVKNLQFTDLSYENKVGGPSIAINGEVLNYNALAYQQEILSKSESLKQTNISDIGLKENGNVKFRFTAKLNPSIVSYKKLIESLSLN